LRKASLALNGLTFRFHEDSTIGLPWIAFFGENPGINESLELFLAGHVSEPLFDPLPSFLSRRGFWRGIWFALVHGFKLA